MHDETQTDAVTPPLFTRISNADVKPPQPLEQTPAAIEPIRNSLKSLEERDWWLPWATLAMLLLFAAAVILLVVNSVAHGDGWSQFALQREQGLWLLVFLLASYAIYQRVLVSRLRAQCLDQQNRAEELHEMALFDPLTGLYNRRMAEQRLAEEMARAQRSNYSLIVLCLDLNDFKKTNDRYGHLAGDVLLREFARRIQKAIRFSDTPVRMGGDEFTLLLPECNLDHVELVLSRLGGLEVEVQGAKIPVTFSAGWAICLPNESPDQLLERADRALYRQKKMSKQKAAETRSASPV